MKLTLFFYEKRKASSHFILHLFALKNKSWRGNGQRILSEVTCRTVISWLSNKIFQRAQKENQRGTTMESKWEWHILDRTSAKVRKRRQPSCSAYITLHYLICEEKKNKQTIILFQSLSKAAVCGQRLSERGKRKPRPR